MMGWKLRKGSEMGNFTEMFNVVLYNTKDPTDLEPVKLSGEQLLSQFCHLNLASV